MLKYGDFLLRCFKYPLAKKYKAADNSTPTTARESLWADGGGGGGGGVNVFCVYVELGDWASEK